MFLGIFCRSAAGRWHRAGLPLLAALLLAASAAAQCLSGDCQNGTGRQDLGYATYEGSFQNGQPEGQGTMDYGGGDKYVGEWRRGKEHGAGQLYKKGVATAATYYNGVLQDKATPPLAMGNKAVGQEKVAGCQQGDCVNGYGVLQTKAGNRYEGQFKDYAFDGAGRIIFASGNAVKAEFAANQPLRGTFTYAADGTVFTGAFGPNWEPLTGTYHSRATGGFADVVAGRITQVRNPRLDSIRAAQPRYTLRKCTSCGGSGLTTSTSYTSEQLTPQVVSFSKMGYGTVVEDARYLKQSHTSFSKCPACSGRGEAMELETKPKQ